MAMTPAEKQRRYRHRHLGVDGQKQRLQCMVSVHAKAQLTRLAHYHGYSITALIETLAAQAERALVDTLPHPDIGPYLDGSLQCNRTGRDPCPPCRCVDDARAPCGLVDDRASVAHKSTGPIKATSKQSIS
jgi:hypothetical protein